MGSAVVPGVKLWLKGSAYQSYIMAVFTTSMFCFVFIVSDYTLYKDQKVGLHRVLYC